MNWLNSLSSRWLFIALAILLTSACGNRYVEDIQQSQKAVDTRLATLKNELDRGSLRNALIVKSYASKLRAMDPSLSEIADVIQTDATSRGTLYQSLIKRAQAVNRTPEKKEAYNTAANELNNIYVASDPIVFNESLIDLVNTLADLSGGELSRVNIPKSDTNKSEKVPGSYLVGNPSYGQWSTNSSGGSFWEWYGKYALFSSLIRPSYGYYGRPTLFNSWYGQPRYSYYHDYGRSSYGSRQDRQGWQKGSSNLRNKGITPSKPKKDYRSNASKKRQSTYAYNQNKSASRQYGAKSRSSGSSSGSSYNKRTSSYGGYSSSFRSNSSSRSFRGGK